jgi:hypothetical protein
MSILVHLKKVIVVRASITIIQNTSVCGHNNSNIAEDYLYIYITFALYTQNSKHLRLVLDTNILASPC